MEKGEMRVEANISVSKDGSLGTKCEVKNLNSFKAVEKAIKFEIERHIELLEKGEKVVQETRGWDENKSVTFSQRAKEDSHDYRYFPDPDLPKLKISEIPEFSDQALKESLPELPWEKRNRFVSEFGIKPEDADIYVREREWGTYFESVASLLNNPELNQLASNYITTDLKAQIKPEDFAELMRMTSRGDISSRGAKDIIKIMEKKGGSPKTIAEENNLIQKSDPEELKKIAQTIILENEKVVTEYKSGNLAVIQFLVGQGMKATKGSGNPGVLKSIFEGLLE